MRRNISSGTRQELVRAIRDRYGLSSKAERRRILDEFIAVTGYHRKHAIRILNSGASADRRRIPRSRLYDEAVRQAILVLWEASDRICGKRLRALLPILIPAMERHGHLQLDDRVRPQLLSVSASTIDRMLAEPRRALGARRRRRAATKLRQSVPVRTFADWNEPLPGHMEGDLVAHCGETTAGSYVNTLVLTDIASGWTECVAIVVREVTLIADALDHLQTTMPFPLRGFDSDNGGEFLNETMVAYCNRHGIEFTRSRPYRKNDQAWVEQKNGAVVRRLVGYKRLEGLVAAQTLSRLYAAARLFVNFFQPSFKLAEKTRIGARVQKRYHPPETPCVRLLNSEAVPDEVKTRLHAFAETLDPLQLLSEIRSRQQAIAELKASDKQEIAPASEADLARFLASLSTAWRSGEVRPTHRSDVVPRRYWRTRKDPFEAVWPLVLSWLEAEPDRTAKELFQRLQARRPGELPSGQLRTLQRRIKVWRRDAAHRLIFRGTIQDDGGQMQPPGAEGVIPTGSSW